MFSTRIASNYNTNKSRVFPNQNTQNNDALPQLAGSNKPNKNDALNDDMRNLLRGLDKNTPSDYRMVNGKKMFLGESKDKTNGFLRVAGAVIDKKLEAIKSKPKYRYKEVSSKIRSAKTAVSAGQALLAAKRNVSEIKRQIRSSKEGTDELMLALSHAKRMEIAARKKKRHLETEELIENTKKLDENIEKQNESGISEQEIRSTIVEEAENKLEDMADDILEEREAMAEELSQSIDEGAELSEDMISELNDMISEYGEEELKQLEENMEMLESMEVIDPHMSDDDFKKLKTKHRASEGKTLVKADMEYLKGMIKLVQEKGDLIQSPMPSAPAGEAISVGFEVVV